MHVTQIVQCCLLFIAHAAGKVGIVESLVASGFGHVFEHAQFLANHLLAVPGHLLHLGQNFIFDVIALLGSQISPGIFFFAEVGTLYRGHAIPLIELLANLILLVGRKALKRLTLLQDTVALLWAERAHLVHPGSSSAHAHFLAGS